MGPGTSSRLARRVLAGVLALLGCAGGDLAAVDGELRHRRHGYAFDAPGPPWKRVAVEGAVVAYRREGPATMSLQSRCGGPLADPATLARHLRIGLPPYTLRQAGPARVAGRSAWSQVFDTLENGRAVRVKTLTLVEGACILDWVLVTGGGFEEAEPDFDAWVASLRLPGGEPDGGGAP